MINNQLRGRIAEMAKELGEHCDSVRIFITAQDENGLTSGIDTGYGNLYAQIGQVQEWMTIQDQYARNHAIRKDAEDDDE